MTDSAMRKILRKFQYEDDAIVRNLYEKHLRDAGVISIDEGLSDRPDIAVEVYRDWQRRPPVACVFARLISLKPTIYDVHWDILSSSITADNAIDIAQKVAQIVEPVKGQEEAVVILFPCVETPESLVLLCKALAQCDDWNVVASYNPSDKLDRVYTRITTVVGPNTEAEVLGVGPFDFFPATRRSPILALHVRTKTERAKSRAPGSTDKAHLADMEWPEGRGKRFHQFWSSTIQKRLEVLGGDDSAARARITFSIPQTIWDEHEVASL